MVISSQQSNNQSQIFSNRRNSLSGFAFALILSLTCIVADDRYHSLDNVRHAISLFIAPVQYAVDYPVRVIGWSRSLMSTKKSLINENMQLRYQQTMLETQLQKLMLLQNENSELKELLSVSSSSARAQTMAAQILAVDTTSARQLVVLNKGSRDGVFVGQPVLDAKGVMGQIIDVGLMTSTVLLISDAKCAVPVRNERTGERGILVGMNSMSHLSLINLPSTSSIAKNDLLVTSGLGRRYPEGYPVGRVEEIKHMPGDDFITVRVSPIALLNRNRLVLLIWPEKEHDELTAQINQRLNILEGFA